MLSMSREAFVDALDIPPPSQDMTHIVDANLRSIVPASTHD